MANLEEIKKAFRVEVSKYHPDVNSASNAEEQFKLIVEAYEVLGHASNRKAYDDLFHIENHKLPVPIDTSKQKEWKETSKQKSKKYANTSIEDLLLLDIFLTGDLLDGLLDSSDSIIDSASDAIEGLFDLF